MIEHAKTAWHRHRRKYLLFLAAIVAAPTGAFVAARQFSATGGSEPTLAELAAKNYRTLSVTESRRLLRYAEREYACLASHDAGIEKPAASRTRITMAAPHRTALDLVRFMTQCDPEVGPPPRGASLQARRGQVLVYVPKRCLLNPAELTSTS
jgi:hypothetical protein